MAIPKVFEIVFKTEVEALDLDAAVLKAKERVASPFPAGVNVVYGVIRDDNLFNGKKDIVSRYTDHVTVLYPKERQDLENIISQLSSSSANISAQERSDLHDRASRILDWRGG